MSLLIIRLIILVLVVWAGLKIWRLFNQRKQPLDQQQISKQQADVIVPCSECGTHLPQASALQEGAKYFCCRAHLVEFNKALEKQD